MSDTSEKLKRGAYYPIGDSLNLKEREQFGITNSMEATVLQSVGHSPRGIRGKWTGEKRCPKKGEWYLSGAIILAYRAPNDLSTEFHIAKLVRIETVTKEIEVPIRTGRR